MDMMEDVFNIDLSTLQNIEVQSASKSAQLLSETPATMIVVTKDQIQKRGYRSLLDLLNDVAGFSVYKFANAGLYSVIGIRGITGQSYLKILRDGIEIDMTKSQSVSVGMNYPLVGVERVEIVYGGSSVVYGGDAVSGIINLITDTHVGSIVDIATDGDYYHLMTKYTGTLNKSVLTIGASVHSDRDYDFDKLYPSLYPKVDIYNINKTIVESANDRDFNYMPVKTQSAFLYLNNSVWTFGANYSKTSDSTYISLVGDSTKKELAYYNSNMISEMRGAYFSYRYLFGNKVNLTSTISYDATELDPESFYINSGNDYHNAYKYFISERIAIDETLRFNISNHKITAGVTAEHYYSMPKSFDLEKPYFDKTATYPRSDINVNYYQKSWDFQAIYIQDQIKITDSFLISFALRSQITDIDDQYWLQRMALIYNSHEIYQKLLYSKSMLIPRASIMYLNYGYFFIPNDGKRDWDNNKYQINSARIPNPDLEAEWTDSYEYNIWTFFNKNLYLFGSVFYTKMQSVIRDTVLYNITTLFPDTTILKAKQQFNNSWAELYGGELGFMFKKSFNYFDLDTWANYSMIDGHELINNTLTELPYIRPHQIKAGSTISWRNFDLTLSGNWVDIAHADYSTKTDPSHKKKIAGYIIGDLYFKYKYTDYLNFALTIKNIGDDRYYSTRISTSTDYRSPQESRQIIFGLFYVF